MITRYTPPFRTTIPPQWRGACAAVAGGGPNRATAIVVARLVFTISGQSRAFTALRLIDIVTAVHSHMNELSTLEFALQQLARLEDELAPDGALPGPLMLALSCRTRIGTVERANAIAAATLAAEAQRVTLGKVMHGDSRATLKVKIFRLRQRRKKRIKEITALLAGNSPPSLVLNRHRGQRESKPVQHAGEGEGRT